MLIFGGLLGLFVLAVVLGAQLEIVDLLGNYAFPVAVCAYLLYDRTVMMKDFQKSIEANTAATNALIELIKK